jgi:protein-disulfide isomerase
VARTTSQRNPLTPFYAVLAVVALIGVIVLLTQLRRSGGHAALEPIPVEIDPSEISRVQGVAIGREDAPVVIYEFADFQCPACAQFATFYTPLIKERLVEPGTVRYVYYDFPLAQHPHSFVAARAARCADEQGRFWEYHDLLYGRQSTWSSMRNAVDFFVDLGREAGLDQRQFEACVRSDRYQEEVSRSLRLGEALGVSGTPTLFVNGRRLQQIPGSYSSLEQIILSESGMSAPAQGGASPAANPGATPAPATPGT